MDYLHNILLQGIDPKDLPEFIQLLADWPMPPNVLSSKNAITIELFKKLGGDDPELALALLTYFPANAYPDRTEVIGLALGNLAAKDPTAAYSLVAQIYPGDFDKLQGYDGLFKQWSKINPTDATAAALKLPPGPMRQAILDSVAKNWADADPKAAIAWAQNLAVTDSKILGDVVNSALAKMAQSGNFDQPTAINDINLLSNLADRNSAVTAIATSLAKNQNPGAAMDWLNQSASGVAYDAGVSSIFNRYNLKEDEVPPLLAGLEKISDPVARSGAIEEMAAQWSALNSADALLWAHSLPDTDAEARTSALNTILPALSKTNPLAAAAFIDNAADPSAYMTAIPVIAQNLAAIDVNAAMTWVGDLPENIDHDQAMGSVLASLAQTNPEIAWNYAESLPAGDSQNTVMTSIVSSIAKQDPAQAVNLAETMPAGNAQLNAIGEVADEWVKQDPQAFTGWMNGLPAGDLHDKAVQSLVLSPQMYKDPAAVLAWANTVSVEKYRSSDIYVVLSTWARVDATAALNAAQTVNLPADQKETLIQKLTPAAGK